MGLVDALALLPKGVVVPVVCAGLGGGAVVTAESRYVKASEWKKSYHLQLKAEIREVRQLISEETDPDEIRELEWDLEEFIDALCVEFPNDRECKD